MQRTLVWMLSGPTLATHESTATLTTEKHGLFYERYGITIDTRPDLPWDRGRRNATRLPRLSFASGPFDLGTFDLRHVRLVASPRAFLILLQMSNCTKRPLLPRFSVPALTRRLLFFDRPKRRRRSIAAGIIRLGDETEIRLVSRTHKEPRRYHAPLSRVMAIGLSINSAPRFSEFLCQCCCRTQIALFSSLHRFFGIPLEFNSQSVFCVHIRLLKVVFVML